MKREVKPPEVRKKELIAAALKCFSENGYENTSVRDILKEVGGEVGMFYHYFKSKDEVFELAIDYYLDEFISDCSEICRDDSVTFQESLNFLIALQYASIMTFKETWSSDCHWSIQNGIYRRTLERLIPHVEILITNAINKNEMSLKIKKLDIHDVTLFLVFGISGVLQGADDKNEELNKKQATIRSLVNRFFMLKESERM